LINQRSTISTTTSLWIQSSWHRNLKRRQLPILRGQIDQYTSCHPTTRSPPQSWWFALMVRIFLCPLVPNQTKSIKEAFTNSALPLLYSRLRQVEERGGICSGQNLTLAGWRHVSKHSQASVTPKTLSKLLSAPKTLPSRCLLSVISEPPHSEIPTPSSYNNDNISFLIHTYSFAAQSSPRA